MLLNNLKFNLLIPKTYILKEQVIKNKKELSSFFSFT